MTTKPQDKPQDKSKVSNPPKSNSFETVITEQIMKALGHPANIHMIQVRPLWENRYRVNVFVGAEAGTTRVAHSFFVTTDSKGVIVESTPNIATKQ